MAGLGPPFSNSSDQFGWPPTDGRLDYPGLMRREPSPVPTASQASSVIGSKPSGLFPQPVQQPDQQQQRKLFDPSSLVSVASAAPSTDFGDGLLGSGIVVGGSAQSAYMRQLSASAKLQGSGGVLGVGAAGSRLAPAGLPVGSGGGPPRSIPGLMLQPPVGQKRLPDPSEFPMLGRPASAGVSGRINFVSAASKAPEEFSIQQEDFPALPGTQSMASAAPGSAVSTVSSVTSMAVAAAVGSGSAVGSGVTDGAVAASMPATDGALGGRSTVVYHANGSVTGVPASMVRDQFGMIGLLSLIKVGEENPNFVIIAPGIDLNTLGLPLNNTTDIYSCMGSPWTDQCLAKPQYIDYPVPQEYLVGAQIKDKLPPPPLEQLQVETLFWLFYNCTCDHLQLSAAKELHRREWRWIKSEKLWVTRCQHNVDKLAQGERGFYYYWDTKTWSRQQKSLTIYYDQIDQSPCNYPDHHVSVSSTLGGSGAGGGVSSSFVGSSAS